MWVLIEDYILSLPESATWRKLHYLPQRLKSAFFVIFQTEHQPREILRRVKK